MNTDDEIEPWAHYMGCDAIATVELLAEVLECREDQVGREVLLRLARSAR